MIIIDNHRYMDSDLHYKQKCRGGDGSNPKRGEGGRVTHATFAWCGARAREPPRWLERQKSQSFTMDHITAALRATCGWLAAVPACWLLCALLPLLPGLLACLAAAPAPGWLPAGGLRSACAPCFCPPPRLRGQEHPRPRAAHRPLSPSSRGTTVSLVPLVARAHARRTD
jgi:hypothetical protein